MWVAYLECTITVVYENFGKRDYLSRAIPAVGAVHENGSSSAHQLDTFIGSIENIGTVLQPLGLTHRLKATIFGKQTAGLA